MKNWIVSFASLMIVGLSPCGPVVCAQDGVSSFSMGLSRAGLIPQIKDIRVEEFINYHRHEIPLPVGNERVRLDMRWHRLDGDRAFVQVGLATPRALDPERMTPLNLVLVIDRSGSMSGDRIAIVKKSLLSLIERLRPTDRVAIVGFSDEACVELGACHKTRQTEIRNAINRIEAGGSTNLYAGLMLGYEQARQHFDQGRTNRVILLTDGIANVGTTDAEEISTHSRVFNQQGISLSTIGLGQDLNQELLRELADAGHGLIHFVSDAEDIEKSFVKELDSLLSPAARKVRLTIESATAQPSKIFGYEANHRNGAPDFRLDDMNSGATQIVLSEWLLSDSPIQVRATLRFVDALTGERRKHSAVVTLDRNQAATKADDVILDADSWKNYSIAVVADAVRESARLTQENEPRQAAKRLNSAIRFAREHSPVDDPDVTRMLDIAMDYRQSINAAEKVSRRW